MGSNTCFVGIDFSVYLGTFVSLGLSTNMTKSDCQPMVKYLCAVLLSFSGQQHFSLPSSPTQISRIDALDIERDI